MVKPVSEEERRRHYTLTCKAADVDFIRLLGREAERLNQLDREKVIRYVRELRMVSDVKRIKEDLSALKDEQQD